MYSYVMKIYNLQESGSLFLKSRLLLAIITTILVNRQESECEIGEGEGESGKGRQTFFEK